MLHGITAIVPVFAFLAGLVFIDSYKLVRPHQVLFSVGVGCVTAATAYLVQTWLLRTTGIEFAAFSRYIAPAIEELLKASFVVVLVRAHRVGFLVDAAIHGFAIGAGFALAENLFYMQTNPGMALPTWIVRGCGTAVMHGGTTAIFAVLAKSFSERGVSIAMSWLLAAAIHSAFNHLVLPPVTMTLILLTVLPALFLVIFYQSERVTSQWLGAGFDSDQELLQHLLSDRNADSRVGAYLATLKNRFPGEVVADMFCYLRLNVEISMRAKGILLMRQAGFESRPDPEIEAKLDEMHFLRKSIGSTGLLAIAPFLPKGGRERWQLRLFR